MRIFWFALLCLALPLPATNSAFSQTDAFPLRFTSRTVVGADALIERPLGAAVTADGGIVISDFGSKKILRFRNDGTTQWIVGRAGGGPGEYAIPSRVIEMPDGSIIVYDEGRSKFTRLNADGKYRDMIEFNVQFHKIDNIVALSNGGVAISGVVASGTTADTAAIHIFDGSFRHVRSFGPLPPMKNPAFLRQWGAGGLSIGAAGELIYSRRHPYEIYKYSTDGRLLSVIKSKYAVTGSPDAVAPRNTGGGTRTMSAPFGVTMIGRAHLLRDGRVLGGRSMIGASPTLDLFSESGTEIATRDKYPDGWTSILASDPKRGTLWVFGEDRGEPVLLRYVVQ